MNFKIILLSAVLMVTRAAPNYLYGPEDIHHSIHHLNDHPSYTFRYGVVDDYGNDFGHEETRDGYNTKGSYYVLLPDGRRQTVTYYVSGDSGYIAEVIYDGEPFYEHHERASHRVPGPHDSNHHGLGHHGSKLHGLGHNIPKHHGTKLQGIGNHVPGPHSIHGLGHRISGQYDIKPYSDVLDYKIAGYHGNDYSEPIFRL